MWFRFSWLPLSTILSRVWPWSLVCFWLGYYATDSGVPGTYEPRAESKYGSLQWLLWDILLVWKMLSVPVFNIKMLSLATVKSWKSERSVNSHLGYLFSFKLEHSSWGERPVQCPAFRAYWNLFRFWKAQGKILFHCKLDHWGTQKW